MIQTIDLRGRRPSDAELRALVHRADNFTIDTCQKIVGFSQAGEARHCDVKREPDDRQTGLPSRMGSHAPPEGLGLSSEKGRGGVNQRAV